MPAITSNSLVLVTGGTGYIGAWTIKDLLARGFSVRAAVRNEHGAHFLKETNAQATKAGKLTTVLVPDILADGAYDEFVKDVDGIVHLASPVTTKFSDPSELIDPALKGTTSIIESAKKFGPKVKRIVMTSSVVATVAVTQLKGKVTLTPADWNEDSVKITERDGPSVHPADAYAASKVLSEKAARRLVDSSCNFDLVTVHPTYTQGPWVHEVKDKSSLRSTMALLSIWIYAAGPPASIVDVRDAATLHSMSLLVEEASGERIFATGDTVQPEDMLIALKEAGIPDLPADITQAGKAKQVLYFDHKRTIEIFGPHGFKFHKWQDTLIDQAKLLVEKNAWGPPTA